MKKIFVWGLMLCCMSTLTFGWGLDRDVVVTNNLASQGEGYPFLIYPVVHGKPVRVYFQRLRAYTAEDKRSFVQPQGSGYLNAHLHKVGVLEPLNSPKFFAELKQAYNDWFSLIYNHFEDFSFLWREFEDIESIVKQGVTLQQTQDPSEADVFVVLADDMSVSKRACEVQFREDACFLQTKDNQEPPHLIIVNKPAEKTNRNWLLRYAAGISLGLTPQIAPGKDQLGMLLADPMHSLSTLRQSLMGGHREFTCDDLDGIINLIDVTFYARQRDPKVFRWYPYGWRSTCHDGIAYVSGTPVDKGPYFIKGDSEEEIGYYIVTTVRSRKITERVFEPSDTETYTPFHEPVFNIDERDNQGRPVHGVAADGLEEFFMYHYGYTDRLVVRGDKFLLKESKETLPNGPFNHKEILLSHSVKYVENGKVKAFVITPSSASDREIVFYNDVNAYADEAETVMASLTIRLSNGGAKILEEKPLHTPERAVTPLSDSGYNRSVNITLAVEKKIRSMSWEELREQIIKFATAK